MMDCDQNIARLVEAHAGFVRATALRFAPAPGVADDIAQQVFLEFVAKADEWDLTRDVRPLFVGITRNIARRAWRDYIRALPTHSRELAEHIRHLAEGEETTSYSPEHFLILKRCVEKLPAKSRRLVELHYYLEIASVEIAAQTAMTADAVRRALFRLREQLRRCIRSSLKEA